MERAVSDAALSNREQLSYIAAQAADARVNVELETEGMTLNIGPQHPATHGTLRIIAKLDVKKDGQLRYFEFVRLISSSSAEAPGEEGEEEREEGG